MSNKIFKAIIIGGGASGLTLAIELSKKYGGQNIGLVERLDRVGKKILSTGNGQCNFTNTDMNLSHYHSEVKDFCESAITKYSQNFVIDYFKNLGVLSIVEEEKVYPLSKQASSILDALRFKLQSLNTRIYLNSKIVKIKKDKIFEVCIENGESLFSENVILSCGGKSGSHLGSDGSSYKLFEEFGHSLTKLTPTLVQLKTETSKIKGLKGLKQKCEVKLLEDNKVVKEVLGDVLFTDYGVSGNAIFSISSYVKYINSLLIIDFCPQIPSKDLEKALLLKQKNCPYLTCEYLLGGIINTKIASSLLRNLNICNLNESIKDVDVKKIVFAIKNYELKIIGCLDFDMSQATRGGLNCNQFDKNTLQSKLVKGLYATGEVLDVVGDCGGYNLQWAFSSAFLVSESIL